MSFLFLTISRLKTAGYIGYTNLVQSTSITAMVTVCNVLSDDMDVLHNCIIVCHVLQ